MSWTYDSAVEKVKKAVKESHINNQRHIDLSTCIASERAATQEALAFLKAFVLRGEKSDADLKKDLGID
jgi:hypothetical protein